MSWEEEDFRPGELAYVRAIALCEGTWFEEAINALRDGSMGEKDGNGVYERHWYGDDIYNADVSDVRPATLDEVKLYLKYCPLSDQFFQDFEEVVSIIYSPERTDVLYKRINNNPESATKG